MLYKRKAITERFRLRRINRITRDPFCNNLICTVMLDGGVINKCRCVLTYVTGFLIIIALTNNI